MRAFMAPRGSIMSEAEQGCTQRQIEITRDDLPLCCPMPDQRLWDAHPRVYMPIEKTGREECPYCAAIYTLKDFILS